MASYQDKINQRKMSTESGKIAFAIDLMERLPFRDRRDLINDLHGTGVPLFDDVSVRRCKDALVYEVSNANSLKYIPLFLTWDEMKDVLDAQPWMIG